MGDERLVAGRRDEEMHVRGTDGAALGGVHERADGTVDRDRIEFRHDRAEPEPAPFVGRQPGAQFRLSGVEFRLLDVVQAFFVSLPDVDLAPAIGAPFAARTTHSV